MGTSPSTRSHKAHVKSIEYLGRRKAQRLRIHRHSDVNAALALIPPFEKRDPERLFTTFLSATSWNLAANQETARCSRNIDQEQRDPLQP